MSGSDRTNIGSNQNTYVVQAADLGSAIEVEVGFTDEAGYSEGPLRSEATDIVVSTDALPAPGKPTVQSSTDPNRTDLLEVLWHPPGRTRPDPPEVDTYDVRYRETGTATWHDGPQDVTETRAVIAGLAEGTRYEVQVRATNEFGDSPWSKTRRGLTRTRGEAKNGDLRLVDPKKPDEGRLEIFHAGQWGTVCGDRFSSSYGNTNYAPALACRQLGLRRRRIRIGLWTQRLRRGARTENLARRPALPGRLDAPHGLAPEPPRALLPRGLGPQQLLPQGRRRRAMHGHQPADRTVPANAGVATTEPRSPSGSSSARTSPRHAGAQDRSR